ncbi:MAG: GAF domain-containing protein [Candidatus Acetothermia bacterium]
MANERDFSDLINQIDQILGKCSAPAPCLKRICEFLRDNVEYFDWVGFYLANGDKEQLTLGPYVGEPTEHQRIEYGRGVCGQSAQLGQTQVIQDVTQESNYLACSPEVKSEIVIPIKRQDQLKALIDIDSHDSAPFEDADKRFLKTIAEKVEPLF